jgi:hypothetical protein
MKPYGKPIMPIMIMLLALIPAACGTELMGGVNAKTADSSSMVAGMASGGSEGSSSVAFMQGGNELNKNVQVNNAPLQSIINVLGGSIQDAIDSASDGDTIKVAPGLYVENVKIDKSLSVIGAGRSKTIVDGSGKDSVFSVGKNDPNVDVILSDMKIQKGGLSANGGGIYNNAALKVKNCEITENHAARGAGIYNDVDGKATVINSNIINNIAGGNGGGILNHGVMNVKNSAISRNSALDEPGGGIHNSNEGMMTIENSRITENYCPWGGGIQNDGTMFLKQSEISKNYAIDPRNSLGSTGGGIFNKGTINLENSLISENMAPKEGGGIYNLIGTLIVDHCSIRKNTAGTGGGGIFNLGGVVTLRSSSITENTANGGGGIYNRGAFTMTGSTVAFNKANLNGGGILSVADYSTTKIKNSLVFKNTPNNIVYE